MVKPLDTLLAIKVINLMPDLVPSDRRVGAALIEHFHRRTGRCDPGLERLAELLGVSTRTVIRSTQRLQRAGLFEKVPHGDYSNRNSYRPNWSRFAELEAAWRTKLQKGSRSRQAEESPALGPTSHLGHDSSVTQTCSSNLHTQTYSEGHPREENVGAASDQRRQTAALGSIKRGDAALVAAERRWTTAVHRRFASLPITYAEVIAAIDSFMHAAATEAEMRRHGAGLEYILRQLKVPG
jgi:predicted transcriptional regulator